jgi:hypothetical protein
MRSYDIQILIRGIVPVTQDCVDEAVDLSEVGLLRRIRGLTLLPGSRPNV